eukprot:Rhum_TRINITY_DN10602_c0_g1::Rhum_TRINITY_DN10602_c0_g1_i1::g.39307::m.39307/K17686/copA, ATP7; Cu+-exporting ATPase
MTSTDYVLSTTSAGHGCSCGAGCACPAGACRCSDTRARLGDRVTVRKEAGVAGTYCRELAALRGEPALVDGVAAAAGSAGSSSVAFGVELTPSFADTSVLSYIETMLSTATTTATVDTVRKSVFVASSDTPLVDLLEDFAQRDTMKTAVAASAKLAADFRLEGASCSSCTTKISGALRTGKEGATAAAQAQAPRVAGCAFDLARNRLTAFADICADDVAGSSDDVGGVARALCDASAEVEAGVAAAGEKFAVARIVDDETYGTSLVAPSTVDISTEALRAVNGVCAVEPCTGQPSLWRPSGRVAAVQFSDFAEAKAVRAAVADILGVPAGGAPAAQPAVAAPARACCGDACDCGDACRCAEASSALTGADATLSERVGTSCASLRYVAEGRCVALAVSSREAARVLAAALRTLPTVADASTSAKHAASVFVTLHEARQLPELLRVVRGAAAYPDGGLSLDPSQSESFAVSGVTCKSCTAALSRQLKKADVIEGWGFGQIDADAGRTDVRVYSPAAPGTPASPAAASAATLGVAVGRAVDDAGGKFAAGRVLAAGGGLAVDRAVRSGAVSEPAAAVVLSDLARFSYSVERGPGGFDVVTLTVADEAELPEAVAALRELSPSDCAAGYVEAVLGEAVGAAPPTDKRTASAAAAAGDDDVAFRAEAPAAAALEFVVGGMKCVSCAGKIEERLEELPWVASCRVNAATSIARVAPTTASVAAGAEGALRRTAQAGEVQKAVVDLGFTAEVLQASGEAGHVFEQEEGSGGGKAASAAVVLKVLRAHPSVLQAEELVDADAAAGKGKGGPLRVRVRIAEGVMPVDVLRDVREAGVQLGRGGGDSRNARLLSALRREDAIEAARRAFFVSLPPSVLLLVYHMVLETFAGIEGLREVQIRNGFTAEPVVEGVLATFVVLACGGPFYKSAWAALRNKSANMAVLVCIGVSTAWLASFAMSIVSIFHHKKPELHFATAAVLLCFMLLGQYLEAKAKALTSEALVSLFELQPSAATVVRYDAEGGVSGTEEVDSEDLVRGVVVRVPAGARVPCDGHVVRGAADIDESMVTGEPLPCGKQEGDDVVGGTVVTNGLVDVCVDRCGGDTMLSHILEIVLEAQNSKAPIQKYADMISSIFVPVIVVLAIFVFFIWFGLGEAGVYGRDYAKGHAPAVFALQFFVATIIIACPCAMGLATPTAIMVGTGLGAKSGILIKSGDALEGASKPSAVLFDKTGTLTLGKPDVTEVYWPHTTPADAPEKAVLLRAVAATESGSDHPIAKAIVKHCLGEEENVTLTIPDNFVSLPGKGVTATSDGKPLVIGKPKFVEELMPIEEEAAARIADMQGKGYTAVVAAYDGRVACVFGIADTLRTEAKEVVAALTKRGVAVHMVTGDNTRAARHVAKRLGIVTQNVHSEILPAGKAMVVRQLQQGVAGPKKKPQQKLIFFVGDGINDTPALAQANIGLAIGGGTHVAVESADVVLIKDDLWSVLHCIQIAAATTSKIKWNFVWAFGYNVLAIPVATGVFYPAARLQLPPVIAGIAMVCSSLTVLLSSLLLKRFKTKNE